MMILVELTEDGGQKKLLQVDDDDDATIPRLLNVAKSKFRKKYQHILFDNQWVRTEEDLQACIVHAKERKEPLALKVSNRTPTDDEPFRIRSSQTSALFYVIGDPLLTEDNALTQLKNTAELQGVVAAIGMPDLHAGKGIPIGAVVLTTEDCAYPQLVDNDIGCGMSFVETTLVRGRLTHNKLSSLAKSIDSIDGPCGSVEDVREMCLEPTNWGPHELEPLPPLDDYHYSNLGTIGGGNHFAELMEFDEIHDADTIQAHDIDTSKVHLLVHSGSRSLGSYYLRQFCDAAAHEEDRPKHGHYGVSTRSPLFQTYLENHNVALNFAARNRKLIAERLLQQLTPSTNNELDCKIDIFHNFLEHIEFDSMDAMEAMANVGPFPRTIPSPSDGVTSEKRQVGWIHRKGATPTTKSPLLVIPGSRGTHSYLVQVNPDLSHASGYSLAHGAGRCMPRSKALKLHKSRYPDTQQLLQTDFGGVVICDKQELVYEEAPGSYKDIDTVIRCLSEDVTSDGRGLVRVLATLRPLLTYKYKNPYDHK
jgi:release factor H-coupled RctB family protein